MDQIMHQCDKIMNIILIRCLILLVFNYYAGRLPATFSGSMTGVCQKRLFIAIWNHFRYATLNGYNCETGLFTPQHRKNHTKF